MSDLARLVNFSYPMLGLRFESQLAPKSVVPTERLSVCTQAAFPLLPQSPPSRWQRNLEDPHSSSSAEPRPPSPCQDARKSSTRVWGVFAWARRAEPALEPQQGPAALGLGPFLDPKPAQLTVKLGFSAKTKCGSSTRQPLLLEEGPRPAPLSHGAFQPLVHRKQPA